MNPWKQYPLIRVFIPFAGGIVAGLDAGRLSDFLLIILCSGFLAGLAFLLFFLKGIDYKNRWIAGLIIHPMVFTLSFTNTNSFRVIHINHHHSGTREIFIGDVSEQPVQKGKSTRAIIRIIAVKDKGSWRRVNEKVLAWIRNDRQDEGLMYGDRLLFRCTLQEIPPPGIPNTFDYRAFLNSKGIFCQAYVSPDSRITLGRKGLNPLIRISLRLRDRLLQVFRDNKVEGREFAVAGALLLGYTDEIDQGLIRDYAATGAMHILSVSGMHVGIIFLVLDKLLQFMQRKKSGMLLKTILVILFIWTYALITGLSPAVLRAAAMLSLVVTGKAMKRNPEVLNILIASVFFLLYMDPSLLMDVGFQLSYLAVLGIVILYRPIYDLYVTSNWLPDKIWAIMAVSIAAQLATTPVSLYYFHQYPNYFMLTNLFVVPLSSLVIYLGILVLALGSVPLLSVLLAKSLIFLVWLLNSSIHLIETFPYSVTKGVYITITEMLLFYAFIILMIIWLFLKRKIFLFASIVLLIMSCTCLSVSKYKRDNGRKIIVYNIRNTSLIDFTGDKENFLAGDIFNLDDYTRSQLNTNRVASGITNQFIFLIHPLVNNDHRFNRKRFFFKCGNFMQFHGKRVGVFNRSMPPGTGQKLRLDLLIISKNPRMTIRELMQLFTFRKIIIDASNPAWKTKQWMEEAKLLKVDCYSVSQSGVFIDIF